MQPVVIAIEDLCKSYKLGTISHRLLYRDLQSWWARLRGREDPNSIIIEGDKPAHVGDIFWALKDIKFEVREADVVGIIGMNGAGKSTLLKIISKITAPTSGRIKLKGRVASLLEVGTGFHRELTGRENIFLNGAILGMSKAEVHSKIDEIIAFSGAEQFIDTPVKRYSSGMMVRLGFAVAAHLDPEILLIDEVLAVGDAAFRKKCMTRIKETSQSGRTILLVSHNMMQVRRICDKAIWIDKGQIRMTGSAREVTLAYEKETVFQSTINQSGIFERKKRHNPNVWIQRLCMQNQKGIPTTEFHYGDDMILDIELKFGKAFEASNLNEFALLWILSDEGEVRISADESWHHGVMYNRNTGRIRCTIPSIPLYKGTYYLDLAITHETRGRQDTWNGEILFNVIYCNPSQGGYERDRRSGFIHIGSNWDTIEAPNDSE